MKKFWLFLIFTSLLWADVIENSGKIESVVLYRGQALVTRAVSVEVTAGHHELVVQGLPYAIQAKSLFANADNSINIRSVRYRTRVVEKSATDSLEGVEKINQDIQKIQQQIRHNSSKQELIRSQEQYLAGLKSYAMNRHKQDIDKGSFDPKSLMEMMGYVFQETKRLNEEKYQLKEELLTLKSKLSTLEKKKKELGVKDTEEVREAVVFFEKKDTNSSSKIHLNYLVSGATWSSTYNVRSQSKEEQIVIEYNALVQQTSGEDWSNVHLKLSTASIEMTAESPSLSAMNVKLQPGRQVVRENKILNDYTNYKNQQEQTLKSRSKMNREGHIQANNKINEMGNNLQILEFVGSRNMQRKNVRAQSALTVHYKIPGKVSIASRKDQQLVEIKKIQLNQELYNITIPLLSEHIYRRARITNTYEIALLEGKANVYLDGQFVGSAFIPMTAKGQKFTLGLGVDTQVTSSRELVSKKTSPKKGNRVIELQYRLSLENYKENAAQVRVFDRVPKNDNNLSVSVTSETELSADVRYQKILRRQGILRWDVEIPQGSKLETPYTITYSVFLEFDKNMSLLLPGQEPSYNYDKSVPMNDTIEEEPEEYYEEDSAYEDEDDGFESENDLYTEDEYEDMNAEDF